jgi:hypothetical protein
MMCTVKNFFGILNPKPNYSLVKTNFYWLFNQPDIVYCTNNIREYFFFFFFFFFFFWRFKEFPVFWSEIPLRQMDNPE